MTGPVRVYITVAWWFRWLYLPGVQTMALLGLEPDVPKLAKVLGKAITIHIAPAERGVRA